MRFIYRGRDIMKSSPEESLAEDWRHVYTAINNNFATCLPAASPSVEREEEDVSLARR
jgi:hypothetical protein